MASSETQPRWEAPKSAEVNAAKFDGKWPACIQQSWWNEVRRKNRRTPKRDTEFPFKKGIFTKPKAVVTTKDYISALRNIDLTNLKACNFFLQELIKKKEKELFREPIPLGQHAGIFVPTNSGRSTADV